MMSFYKSIEEDIPPPFSYKEIILTTKIMDDIFEQIPSNKKKKGVNLW